MIPLQALKERSAELVITSHRYPPVHDRADYERTLRRHRTSSS